MSGIMKKFHGLLPFIKCNSSNRKQIKQAETVFNISATVGHNTIARKAITK